MQNLAYSVQLDSLVRTGSVMQFKERERGFYMLQPDDKSDRMCHGQMPMTIPNETSSMCIYLIVLNAIQDQKLGSIVS